MITMTMIPITNTTTTITTMMGSRIAAIRSNSSRIGGTPRLASTRTISNPVAFSNCI